LEGKKRFEEKLSAESNKETNVPVPAVKGEETDIPESVEMENGSADSE
jgi:small subunit ribosomal protein S2